MHKIKKQKFLAQLFTAFFAAFLVLINLAAPLVQAATTTPATINYQGRLLNSSGTPLTGAYTFRFSLWSDADWDAGDETGAGAINVAAPGYEGWQETDSITVGTFGLFDITLGDGTAFPSFTAGTHDYLQVEVKSTGSPDTSYEVLDPTSTLADTTDRKTIHNQAYAQNADTIDNADVGTAVGELATLSAGGVWSVSQIPSGTNQDSFTIDDDASAATVSLQFGDDATDGVISFANASGDFTIATPGDDLINIDNGTLTATSDAGFNFSSADQFRIREDSDPDTNSACGTVGELIFDTTDNQLQRCTTIGSPGTWTNIDTTGGSVDFEGLYSNDADKVLTTSNGNFSIAAGSGNFIVDGATISIDATDDSNLSLTANDGANKTLTISATNAGAGDGLIDISTDVWDITGAGVASGLTGLTSTGIVNFSNAGEFRIRENSDPASNAACTTLDELIVDTTDNEIQICTAVGAAGAATWENVSAEEFSDLNTRAKELVFSPEFPHMSVEPDGSNNRGKLISDFVDDGGAAKRNFYEFTTRQTSLQDFDIVVSFQLPLDFVSFTGAPLSVNYNTNDAVTTNNRVDVELFDTAGAAVGLTGASALASATWATANITFGGGETFNAGDTVTLKLKLTSLDTGFARVSDVVFNYNGR